MKRGAIISCLALLAHGSFAQGIPTVDPIGIAQNKLKMTKMLEDFGLQQNKMGSQKTLSKIGSEQLAALDKMQGAMMGRGYDVTSLEAHSDFGADQVYPVSPDTPMDKRLFGDGRETIEKMIVQVAAEYAPQAAKGGLTPTQFRALFQALIKQESRFNITAQSHVGAYGLTQLMPGTASDMGVDRYVPIQNLRGGAKYITTQLKTFGNIPHALAAYNAGPGNVRKYGGVPPFKETQGYVRKISKYYAQYLSKMGSAGDIGTLDPSDMGLAEYANTSDAFTYYSAASYANTNQVIARLRAIIEQIDAQPNAKAAIELNTYARVEVGRILAMRQRLMAANQMRVAKHEQHLVADRLAEKEFKKMSVSP